jgi:hypothetical protein
MNDAGQDALTQEWVTLQNNHERYEHSALFIKIVAILVFAIGIAWSHATTPSPGTVFGMLCFVLCVLWAQEAILRTSQARLGTRLLRIEMLQRSPGSDAHAGSLALQLHSEWQASRAGSLGLLGEYARNALRPTVAFPHVLLAVLTGLFALAY